GSRDGALLKSLTRTGPCDAPAIRYEVASSRWSLAAVSTSSGFLGSRGSAGTVASQYRQREATKNSPLTISDLRCSKRGTRAPFLAGDTRTPAARNRSAIDASARPAVRASAAESIRPRARIRLRAAIAWSAGAICPGVRPVPRLRFFG